MSFYQGFFAEGWLFFYKMCLSIMLRLFAQDRSFTDAEEVYMFLKLGKHDEIEINDNIKKWDEIIQKAFKIEINR